jgi:hypothetical protein
MNWEEREEDTEAYFMAQIQHFILKLKKTTRRLCKDSKLPRFEDRNLALK